MPINYNNIIVIFIILLQAVLNFGCCLFFQFVSFIHETVFGKLQNTEKKVSQLSIVPSTCPPYIN